MQSRTAFLLGVFVIGGLFARSPAESRSAESPWGVQVAAAKESALQEEVDPFKPIPPVVLPLAAEGTKIKLVAEPVELALGEGETAAEDESVSLNEASGKDVEDKASEDPAREDQAAKVQGEQVPLVGTADEETLELEPAPKTEAGPAGGDDTPHEPELQDVAQPQRDAEPASERKLPPAVRALQPRIRRVLDVYYQRPADISKYDVWEAMHSFLPYGVDAQVRAPQYRQPVNTIGWICWNGPCRGHRLFELDKQGRLVAKQGPRVQGHHGQFLAMLAQSYVPPSFEIRVQDKKFTVADLIEFEKETCVPKSELTFKLLALSHYLPADATWKSRDGEQWSIERLLREEITQNVIGAACGGTHRLGGITFAVKNRRRAGLPMDGTWAKAEDYLDAYLKYTFQIQNPDGSFSTNWFDGRGMENDLERRLQTSGHILEFVLFALPEEELTSPEVVRAVNYVTTILERNPRREWSIGSQGHALHALAMYDQKVFGTKPGSRSMEIVHTSRD